MSGDVRVRPTAVVCGLLADGSEPLTFEPEEWEARCEELLWWTHGPASTLWCPVHGDVVDARPPGPVDLTATIVCGPDGCTRL